MADGICWVGGSDAQQRSGGEKKKGFLNDPTVPTLSSF